MAAIQPIGAGKVYSVAQAARLAGTSPRNVRNWLFGDDAPSHKMEPVVGAKERVERLSFLELAELIVVARFRRISGRRIPLWRLRAAHAFASKQLKMDHPFASGRFQVEGGHVIHEYERDDPGPGKIAVDQGGHYVLPLEFNDALDLFDFDRSPQQFATRWYPAGRDKPVVIEPGYGAGQPVIVGRNIRASVLFDRWKGGWSIDELAEDFQLPRETVEAAVKAEVALAA